MKDTVFKHLFDFKQAPLKSIGYLLIILALVIGFTIRFFCLIRYTTFDIGYDPDQIRDAFVYMKMWEGKIPLVGPGSSVGTYSLPPLYYYLIFPFTIFGANPVFQVLPHTLLSFLTIPLLMCLVYQLLEKVPLERRILLSGLAGILSSCIYGEIFINTFQWNPSPLPFFFLSFTLLYKYQVEARKLGKREFVIAICYGIATSILVSLHSTTLFIIPIVFFCSTMFLLYKRRKQKKYWLLPVLSVVASIVALLPYWKLELSQNFSNTKAIIRTVIGAGENANSVTILGRIGKIITSYFELGQQAYFVGLSKFYLIIAAIFLALTLLLAVWKFKGNKTIICFLSLTWLLFFYAASNFQGIFRLHYKLLIIFMPIILVTIALGYLDYDKRINKIFGIIISLGIVFSLGTNFYNDGKYLASKYGYTRIMSTTDLTAFLEEIPLQATICDPQYGRKRKIRNSVNYLDTYITKRQFSTTSTCQPSNYQIIPKYKMDIIDNSLWPIFNLSKNRQSRGETEEFLDTPVAEILIIE